MAKGPGASQGAPYGDSATIVYPPAMRGLDNEALILVEQCLALPEGGARDDFLRSRTEGNDPLRERVEELLSRAGWLETEDFLPSAYGPARLPERVGPFRTARDIC